MKPPKRFRLTNKCIEALLPHDADSPSKCAYLTHGNIKGLSVQITKTGTKSFWFAASVSGKKRSLRIGAFPAIGVAEAEKAALAIRAAVDRGENPFDERARLKGMPTFREFVTDQLMPFFREYKRSADDDWSKFTLYQFETFGDRRLCDITQRDIEMYLAKLGKKLSKATCNRHRSLLSKVFRQAIAWGFLTTANPVANVAKFKEEISHQKFLTPDEVRRVIEAALTDMNAVAGDAIRALLLTGCRREEIMQARIEHYDPVNGTQYLPKTKSKARYVILNDAAKAVFDKRVAEANGSPWLFPGRDTSKPLANPWKAFRRILEAAGVEVCRLHDLRHSFCSTLVAQGVSLFQVQQLVGHASPQTTLRYAHLGADTLRQASNVMTSTLASR